MSLESERWKQMHKTHNFISEVVFLESYASNIILFILQLKPKDLLLGLKIIPP